MQEDQTFEKNTEIDTNKTQKTISQKQTVDINILLNRVRADKRKEKIESTIFISIIALAVISSGLVLSFR